MSIIKVVSGYAPTKISLDPRNYVLDMATDMKLILGLIIVTLTCIYITALDNTIIRLALGLIMVLFVPGYTFMAAMFPGRKDIDGMERAMLSLGLSVMISPLIGLVLNYTPWGIRLEPIVVCLAIFSLVCVLFTNKRRHDLPEKERFIVDFAGMYRQFKAEVFSEERERYGKAFAIITIISILLSIGMLAYAISAPKHGGAFTELYILGSTGKANNYPTAFNLSESKPVYVVVVNHEGRNVTYDLVITLNDSANVTDLYTEQLMLSDNQTWKRLIELRPDRAGTDMDMGFLLYADGNMTAPYRDCRLWINVTSPV